MYSWVIICYEVDAMIKPITIQDKIFDDMMRSMESHEVGSDRWIELEQDNPEYQEEKKWIKKKFKNEYHSMVNP